MKKFISSFLLLSALMLMGTNGLRAQWVNTCVGPNPGFGMTGGHESTTNNDKIYVRSETFTQDQVRNISHSITVNGVAQPQTIIVTPPTAPTNYHFQYWVVADYANPSVTDTTTCNNIRWFGRDRIYTAAFAPDTMAITVRSAEPTQAASTDSIKYVPFDGSVTIRVTPLPGYVFDHWNDGDTNNPRLLTHVNGNNVYTAYYVRDSFNITTAVQPRNGLIDGSVTGAGRYSYLDTATLTAVATRPNYRFSQWTDGDTTNPRYVAVLGNATYTAVFAHDTIDVQASVCYSAGTYAWEGTDIDLTTIATDTATIVRTKSFRSVVSGIANDSVRRLTLTVYKDIVYTETQDTGIACNSYTWRGTTYTLSGTYNDPIVGAVGGVCDIVYTITLDIKHDSTINTNVTACDSYVWHGNTYTSSAVDTYNYTNADGCPSVENLILTINYNSSSSYSATQCDSYEWGDSAYTASGVYLNHYNTSAGCPSVDTLFLTIKHNSNVGSTDTVCNEYKWVDTAKSLNITYTATGVYYHNYTSAEGCPSVDTLNLTVYYDSSRSFTQSVCDTFTWTNNDSIKGYNVSGTYYNRYFTTEKCLSVDTLYLTVSHNSDTTINDTVCNEFVWRDAYRNIDSVYTASVTNDMFSVANDAGCLSNYTLTLTVYYDSSSADLMNGVSAVCDSYIWTKHDGTKDTLTASGTYFDSYVTTKGCPSVDTLYLDVKYSSSHDTTFRYVCDSLVWDGNVYKTVGAYDFTYSSIKNAVFCDSIEHINLLGINNSTNNTTTETTCESYSWHDSTYTASTTDTYSYENADGCASVDTLYLTITNYTPQTPVVVDSLGQCTWNGDVYTHSGHYGYINPATCQIDSIALTIRYTVVAVAANPSFDTAIHINTATPAEFDTVKISVNRIRNRGKQFASWNDGNTDNPRIIIATSNINLVATFTDVYHTVTAVSANDTFGSVQGSGSYPFASSARLVAEPAAGYHFLRWNDYNTANPRYVNIADTDYYFTAYFAPNSFTVTAVSADPATGSVSPASATATTGQGVTLTATPRSGFSFTRWHDGVTANPRTVYPTADTTYTAYFDMLTTTTYDTVCKKWKTIVMRMGGDTVVRDTNSARTLATVHHVHFKRYVSRDIEAQACGVLPYSYTTANNRMHVVNQSVSEFADTINYTSTSRCDSIKHYTLTVKSPSSSEMWDTVCDQLAIADTILTQTGNHTVTTTNVYGCDSIITLHLRVDNHRDSITLGGVGCDSVVWRGLVFTETDTVINYLPAVAGNVCPIVEHAYIIVNQASRDTITANVCAGAPYRFITTKRAWQDTMYEERRGHNPTNGCDSIHTISLHVYALQSIHDTQSACLVYRNNGLTYTSSGNYSFRYTDVHHCDSVVTLHLTIETEPVREFTAKGCEQYTWALNGETYTTNSVDTVHVPSAVTACDSVIRMRLTIYQKPSTSMSGDVCLGQSYVGNGFSVAADSMPAVGTYSFLRTRGYDVATTCDSLYTLNIEVHGADRTSTTDTACLTYSWNGFTYGTSGNYSYRTRNRFGCDSVSILHLTINHERYANIDTIACGSFEWLGVYYTNDSLVQRVLVASNGCDSILTVNYSVKDNYRDTVPVGPRCDSLFFMNEMYRDNFDLIRNYPTVYGCDSLVLYQIRVNHTTVLSIHDTIAPGETYSFHGHNYSMQGTWPIRVPGDEVICDSIYMLYLVVMDREDIDEAGAMPNISLYPNPTTGVLHIGNGEATHVDVLDIVGRLVARYENTNTIDLSKLPAGSYTLRITLPEGVLVRKVVKR